MSKNESTDLGLPNYGPDTTRVHYRQFHNIFLYVTEQCQLRCKHCYMGDRLDRGLMIDVVKSQQIMKNCRRLGAEYITLLGGEPTLHPELPAIVDAAVNLGFKQVMIDTNGILFKRLLPIDPAKLYYVSVSVDGATAETHDHIRGAGAYRKAIKGISALVNERYAVRVNYTVCRHNFHEAATMLRLADQLGVRLVNFHTFSEEGAGTNNLHLSLSPEEWIRFYENLEQVRLGFNVAVWYPPTWARFGRLARYVEEGFRGCLGCSLDRLSIFPDGRCYLCSVLFDEASHFALMTERGLELNKKSNEFNRFTEAMFTASHPSLSGCPAETTLERNGKAATPDGIVSMCRCWKSQV